MKVAAIHVYPVKSLAGQEITAAEVEPWGLRHDRRWLVLEADGSVLTAREEHRLLGLSAKPTENGIELTSRDGQTLAISTPIEGEIVPTTLSRLDSMRMAAPEAQRWISQLIERPVRLAWLDDPRRRSVSDTHGGQAGDSLTLADAGPLLLTSTASLRQLNDWMFEDALRRGDDAQTPMEMARFRANVVVDEVPEAFEEDCWRTLRIGAGQFRFTERCDRCVMTTIDPQTLLGGKEPLRTMGRHRQWDHKTWFGIRLVAAARGVIRVGDSVEILVRAIQP